MNQKQVSTFFGEEQAAAYDTRWAKTAPIRQALELLTRTALQDLPEQAHILCVGAGTGSELIDLAQTFPKWRFTAVDPSPAMLAICRQKAEAAHITSRCAFHEGFLDSLPPTDPFDAATSLLVSQFLTDPNHRRAYFTQIAKRLRPGGILINADLASSFPVDSPADQTLIKIWLGTHGNTPGGTRAACCSAWGKDVAVLPPKEIEAIIQSAGFEDPIPIYQALFIHAWLAKVSSGKKTQHSNKRT